MKKIFLLLLLMPYLFGCNENTRQESPAAEPEGLAQQIEVESNRRVELTSEASQEVSQWLGYATAQNEIRDLKSATGYQIITSSQPLVQIMEALETTLPETLKATPIETRVNVLNTKAKVLHQLSTKKDIDTEEIFNAANDLLLEFDNFKLQLNERFLGRPDDFELELEREFREAAGADEE